MDIENNAKQKILLAAMQEFSARGLAGARVDEIARIAGVNKALIYYYFDGKESLFHQVFQSEMESLKQAVSSILKDRASSSLVDMKAAVKELLDYIQARRDFLRVFMTETPRSETHHPELFQLVDLTMPIGLELARQNGHDLPAEPVMNELFIGLLPLIYFVLLRDDLIKYYSWPEDEVDERFISFWLAQHGGIQ